MRTLRRCCPALPAVVLLVVVLLLPEAVSLRPARLGSLAAHAEAQTSPPAPTSPDESRLLAEKVFAEGERLRAEWKVDASRAALEKYEEAARLWRAAGDRRAEAFVLRSTGQVAQSLNETQQALASYKQALALSRTLRDRRGESAALNDIGYLYFSFGDNAQAIRHARAALRLSRADGNRRDEAQSLYIIGEAFYGFGELQKALLHYRQAQTLWRELDDRDGQARVLVSFGYTYVELSEIPKAFDAYHEALALCRATGDRRWEAITLRALGNLQTKLGEHQDALDNFNAALKILETLDDLLSKATVLAGIGYTYEKLGEKQLALDYDSQAVRIFQSIKNQWGEAELQMDVGRVYYSLGENEQALEHYRQALALFRTLSMSRYEAQTLRDIGLVYDSLGDKTKALDCYQQSLALTHAGQDQRYEAYTLTYIGRLYESLGERGRALDYYRRALPLNRVARDLFGEALTLYYVGRVERDRGNLEEARAQVEASLRIVESLRTKVVSEDLRASYFASVQQHYELYVDVLMQLHRARPGEGFAARALEAAESARARSLLETLSESRLRIRQGIDPTLVERERELQQALNEKAQRQARVLGGAHTPEEAAALDREIGALATRYDEVKARIKLANPHYAALTQPQPLGLREIQSQLLDERTLMLKYALGEGRSYLWAVTKRGVEAFELPGRKEIESKVLEVRELLTAYQRRPGESYEEQQARLVGNDARYWHEAAALSDMLLRPVAAELADKHLLIIPDGALQYIPFAPLPEPRASSKGGEDGKEGDGEAGDAEPRPLILAHEITYEPSASTLAVLRTERARRQFAPRAVAVFGDPVFEADDERIAAHGASAVAERERREAALDLAAQRGGDASGAGVKEKMARLPASRREVEAIMEVAPAGASRQAVSFDASKRAATDPQLGQYAIIHFATHGELNSEHPELSCLVFSLFDERGEPQDGYLRLHDIYNLDLPAELVVLSACNTALGKEIKGEGLVGLTRGFMYAGAPRVMASLWKVDDEATASLMKQFYQRLLQEGKPPAAALREAQVSMWRQKRWRAPYFWAAFVLQGEYEGSISIQRSPAPLFAGTHAAAGAGGLLTLLLGSIYTLRRRRRRRSALQSQSSALQS